MILDCHKWTGRTPLIEKMTLADLMSIEKASEKNRDKSDYFNDRPRDPRWTLGNSFVAAGIDTVSAVRKVIESGWSDGAEKIQRIADGLTDKYRIGEVQSVRRKVIRSDHGDDIDIHSVYAGDLDHAWSRVARVSAATVAPIVTIGCALSMSCRHEGDDTFWRGACSIILADTLERAGFRTQIVAAEVTSHVWLVPKPDSMIIYIPVKEPEDHLDIEKLASVLCNPAILRVFAFRYLLSKPWKANENFGFPIHNHNPMPAYMEMCDIGEAGHQIWCDGLWDESAAVDFIKSELENVKRKVGPSS